MVSGMLFACPGSCPGPRGGLEAINGQRRLWEVVVEEARKSSKRRAVLPDIHPFLDMARAVCFLAGAVQGSIAFSQEVSFRVK